MDMQFDNLGYASHSVIHHGSIPQAAIALVVTIEMEERSLTILGLGANNRCAGIGCHCSGGIAASLFG
ncbi:MAG: hypothetical protein AAGF31_02585 [Planctomycetota bacterium]